MLNISVQFPDDRGAAFYPQHAAVQSYVIILSMTPFHVGIEAVVGCAALVFVLKTLLGGILSFAVNIYYALGAEFHVSMNENLQTVSLVSENVVGTFSDDDT